ncbi:aerobactin synthase|uniref:Aerobactin synthase n=1 Tax=Brenneria salicis ATCC 15712 = DSM 30166 TaxID=714314 RepID=A0A366IAE8_9GAMM|nr:IucA/IucC family siderophore biosynthesis protein [Brenneria salicis]NMN90576.1 aerobactin synthase [Brenneria salicis ATCC 15712 = DSM 30166]RBP66933.1 aerobactin synthase [Brenneria salicis ATCC 15712 = DSM 30166]RLM32097.1 aerobactin synthase IucC [Brenneria salicis ATCC 15712 = DSM 30166]
MNDYREDWQWVNRLLVAKMLAELEYERTLQAEPESDGQWRISLPESEWRFAARRDIWGWLWIDADSVRCEHSPITADALLRQLAPRIGMNDAQIAEHLEDLYATLRGDLQLRRQRRGMSAQDLIALDAGTLQCLLSGHPKFVFNKGRRGWGLDDLRRYAPEYRQTFRLHWLAVRRECAVWSHDDEVSMDTLLQSAMNETERQRFQQHWQALGLTEAWLPMPAHPWQWWQKIALHFLPQLAEGEIISLGEFGDHYLAQQSLRTLTNASRRSKLDVKLPLTIYNTSCYRGIPGKYIAAGPLASRWLQQIVASDPTLNASGAVILGEPAAGYLAHSGYQTLKQAPYRYQEMLGVIWRENPSCYLHSDEQAILMATLMECDEQGQPLIGAYIAQSGLDAETWLRQLFRTTVVPLYHLLCRYGVSLIAHGQNITLAMKKGCPQRVLLKDFQGDMRLTQEDFPERHSLPDAVSAVTVRLSADYLIHDLQTGHFVTVLRFISPLTERLGISETRFYQLLAGELHAYMDGHPHLAERFALFDLFKPAIIRVVLNPVKLTFSEHDGGNRMLPNYLKDLPNPLWLVAQEPAQ